jgi:hypothetical protein
MFLANPVQPFSPPSSKAAGRTESEHDQHPRDDGWDATGVLVFAVSLLSLGGSGLVLLLRVTGLLS